MYFIFFIEKNIFIFKFNILCKDESCIFFISAVIKFLADHDGSFSKFVIQTFPRILKITYIIIINVHKYENTQIIFYVRNLIWRTENATNKFRHIMQWYTQQ